MGLLAGCAAGTIAGTGGPAGPVTVPPSTPITMSVTEPFSSSCETVGGPTELPVPTPTGPPMLTVTQGSNSWIANSRTEPYAIAVYPDGTAIRAEADGSYAESLPDMTIGRIDPCLLARTVFDLGELAGSDLGDPTITDQGTTSVTLAASAAGGSDVLISAYALGIGDEYVEAAQLAARQRLGAAIAALLDGLQSQRPWIPESLRVTSLGAPQGNLADRPPALDWPLATALQSTVGESGTPDACGELTDQDATAVLRVLAGQPAATMWTDGQQKLVLAIGVLVPGQIACPTR
jgi:hypothetical protein